MLKTWFHRWGSPPWFYRMSGKLLPWLGAAAFLLLLIGSVWGLAVAPEDARQGNSYRIIYIHVPSAFLALAGYYLMAIAGCIGLVWRMKLAFWALRAAAPLGAAMTFIALITGSFWGKPTWGTWWEWDARITSMLILFFLYLGVMALANAYQNTDNGNRAASVLALVGTVNIPIIYMSVKWWNTLHQGATLKLTSASTIDPSMLQPLWVMIVGFYCLYAVLLLLNLRCEILSNERNSRWLIDLFNAPSSREKQ
ncbi:MAG: heme ABC transporter permease [Cellvibrionales bacterium]|jgi:heme exporter protein C|nr:heme ABC transporter permease [Cellvibrionales bacterium]MBK8675904.1 heme ABC transporter permease [Cellvibrionales bacterium]HRF88375.1 heme ABC transporter permease [Pseudomonadales bacterium]HRG49655.1 heme ABC transporter permease [Pseudomonadales bacterium]